jgi:predicted DNA-binding protein (MmcQ/YjbR family)
VARRIGDRLATICLALPEATEVQQFGGPTWRVRNKIFAMANERDGRPAVWCKAPPGSQEILTGADPERFFAPPYLGPKGWVAVYLDRGVDWSEVAVLIARSYRLVAPRKLAALVEEPASSVR